MSQNLTEKLHILILGASPVQRSRAARMVRLAWAMSVLSESESLDAATQSDAGRPDCIVMLPNESSSAVVDQIRELRNKFSAPPSGQAPPILAVCDGNADNAAELIEAGAADAFSMEALSADRLRSSVRLAVELDRSRTEARRAHAHLETQNHHLLQLNQLAKDFVDQVSEEFRSPLSVIRESASILYDGLLGSLADEQKEYVAIVIDRASDLAVQVDDLVDMSRLEAGSLPVRRSFTSVNEIMEQARTTLQYKAVAGRMRMDFRADPILPEVFCDPDRAARIIVHLAMHAMKFCAERRQLAIWARPDPDRNRVRIGVSLDAGRIDAEGVRQLLGRFRDTAAADRSSGAWCPIRGFGRGLGAVRELARLNFGDVFAEGQGDRGLAFWFTLPCGGPVEVMREYLERLKPPPAEPSSITLLSVRCDPGDNDRAERELGLFLQQFMRSNDLLFPLRRGAWLLAAACDGHGASRLMERFDQAWLEAARSRKGTGAPRVHFEQICCWPRTSDAGILLAAAKRVLDCQVAV